uniref:Uncharacterized protein n=1 Tax=Scleropages formosus TaxID=113540 RepID=A0A8C9TWU9_SCLFO
SKRKKKNHIIRQNRAVNCIVNRWNVDYYVYCALESFRDGQYTDFCQIRDILQSLMARPLEMTDQLSRKLRVMQFLSRINEGNTLGEKILFCFMACR